LDGIYEYIPLYVQILTDTELQWTGVETAK